MAFRSWELVASNASGWRHSKDMPLSISATVSASDEHVPALVLAQSTRPTGTSEGRALQLRLLRPGARQHADEGTRKSIGATDERGG